MISYNVTVKVEKSIADSWVYWMKAEHMPDLMGTDLFLDCRLSRLLDQDETDGRQHTPLIRMCLANSSGEFQTGFLSPQVIHVL